MNFGHYVAFGKNSITGQWYRYNDSAVHPITTIETELVTDAAYVLFYKLRGFEEAVGESPEGSGILDFAAIKQVPKSLEPLTVSAIKGHTDADGEFAIGLSS